MYWAPQDHTRAQIGCPKLLPKTWDAVASKAMSSGPVSVTRLAPRLGSAGEKMTWISAIVNGVEK